MWNGTLAFADPYAPDTVNGRLRTAARDWQWIGLLAAAALHFVILAGWPELRADDVSIRGNELISLEVPPEVQIPPPPADIPRPSVPTLSLSAEVDPDVTIGPMDFESNPPATLPPPPVGSVSAAEQPMFTPYEVRPELRNRAAFLRELTRRYPSLLRTAGIGGTTVLWVFVDETGAVQNTRVMQSSGNPELDRIAQEVMRETGRFSPALNRDQRVPVWIQMPVTFTVER